MKKICLLISFIILSLSAFSQGRNKISFSVTPLASFKYDYKSDPELKATPFKEKRAFGAGVAYAFHLGYGLHLGAGLSFMHYKVEGTASIFMDNQIARRSQVLNYLSMPIDVKYMFLRYFYVNAGGDFNYRMSEIKNEYFDQGEDVIFGFHAGVGAEYEFYDDYKIFLSPYIQTIDSDKLFSYGLKIGIEYRF